MQQGGILAEPFYDEFSRNNFYNDLRSAFPDVITRKGNKIIETN